MKSSIALIAALVLGLAGCSAATSPAWQNKAGAVAYQSQDTSQPKASPTWDDGYIDYRP
jgi:PBP1b-binding outer membrane lipoprotein LpoB